MRRAVRNSGGSSVSQYIEIGVVKRFEKGKTSLVSAEQ